MTRNCGVVSKGSRLTVFLLTVLLAYLSVGYRNYNIPPVPAQSAAWNRAVYYFQEKTFCVFCLQNEIKISANPGNTYPVFNLKDSSANFFANISVAELRIKNITSRYFFCARQIRPGLTLQEIIYPFHFFT
jgi:hypothetical protein